MIVCRVLQCGVLAASLIFVAAPAGACEGPGCAKAGKAASPSKPLQLNHFMRRPSANAERAAKTWRAMANKGRDRPSQQAAGPFAGSGQPNRTAERSIASARVPAGRARSRGGER